MIIIQFSVDPFLDEEGVRYVPVRPRPPITLLRHYRNPWKAAYHHFQRYSDVRVKGQPAACGLTASLTRGEPPQITCEGCLGSLLRSPLLIGGPTKKGLIAVWKTRANQGS